MEKKKKSNVRVARAESQRPSDTAAMRKIARAVIAIAARQMQHEAGSEVLQKPSSKREKR